MVFYIKNSSRNLALIQQKLENTKIRKFVIKDSAYFNCCIVAHGQAVCFLICAFVVEKYALNTLQNLLNLYYSRVKNYLNFESQKFAWLNRLNPAPFRYFRISLET